MREPLGGWIYILMSSSNYTRCKIGRTANNPLDRYTPLRTGDPELGFVVAYFIPEQCHSVEKIESGIHFEFQDQRLSNHDDGKTEWFRIDTNQAIMLIEGLLEEWCDQKISNYHSSSAFEGPTKMWAEDLKSLFNL